MYLTAAAVGLVTVIIISVADIIKAMKKPPKPEAKLPHAEKAKSIADIQTIGDKLCDCSNF
ncbi:MAG: hypothetical protein WC900_03800 [Oscillospiraceae bacterium]|jgi:hypothetical protein